MGILKRIIHIFSYICYLFIGVYVVISIPILLKYNPVVVLSGSMEPIFQTGSVIYYKEVQSENDIQVGDIITYELNGNILVTHRVIDVTDGLYYTKGDANNTSDPTGISLMQIKGKVTWNAIPYIGYFIQYVNNHYEIVIVVLIILIFEFLLSNFIPDSKNIKYEEKKEKEIKPSKEKSSEKKVINKNPNQKTNKPRKEAAKNGKSKKSK